MVDTYNSSDFEVITERSNITPDNLLDCWSFYDYKAHFRIPSSIPNGPAPPSWVPPHHQRRLRAYRFLDSLYKLCARRWLEAPELDKKDRREYGDFFLLVEAVKSSVLGDEPKIVVEGILPDDPATTSSFAKACQEQLDDWAESETYYLKLVEFERNSQKLGDAVWVLGWDTKKKRPRLRVYDPGFYFPVEDPESDEDYPEKVHIAYEFEVVNSRGEKENWVRRITWELRDVPAYSLPWNDGATESCFMQDRKWKLGNDSLRGDVEDFSLENSVNNLDQEELNLGVDFIPVVHVPNMATEGYLWGQSIGANVIQLMDDIVATDTDLQNAAALTGSPVIGIGGAQAPKNENGTIKSYGPGTVYETGDGKMDLIDTSHSLDALLKLQDAQLERLSVNARTPDTLLGRVDPGQIRAGIILTLSFAPHSTMIREMREIRRIKHGLLLKFVLRMFVKEGILSKNDKIPTARLVPGSYLPADKTEVNTIVTTGVPAKTMSLETAIKLQMQAGLPIDSVDQEVTRIEKRDFSGADMLASATNDTQAARDHLKLGGNPPPLTTVSAQEQAAIDQQNQAAELAAKARADAAKNPQNQPPK